MASTAEGFGHVLLLLMVQFSIILTSVCSVPATSFFCMVHTNKGIKTLSTNKVSAPEWTEWLPHAIYIC